MAVARHFRRVLVYRSLIYEDAYVWLMLFAALEAVLTWAIFLRGGMSLGHLGEMVVRNAGLQAIALYQLVVAVLLVVICEEIGRRRLVTGRHVANLVAGVWGAAVLILALQFFMTF